MILTSIHRQRHSFPNVFSTPIRTSIPIPALLFMVLDEGGSLFWTCYHSLYDDVVCRRCPAVDFADTTLFITITRLLTVFKISPEMVDGSAYPPPLEVREGFTP